jgi:CRAL/TRIO domain
MGWPWMKDAAASIVEKPIPPVQPSDDRPALMDLFKEHRAAINAVAAELAASDALYDTNKHDDLWILRFLLSHKINVAASVKAAKHALAFRAEHKLDEHDLRYYTVGGKDVPVESIQRYLNYCKEDTFQFVIPDAKLGVVAFLDLAGIDQHGLVYNLGEEDWLPSFIYVAEWTHQWVDYLSRTSGRLTASVRIVNVAGMSRKGLSWECQRRDGKAMKVTEDCYPQMLKTLFVCNSPFWIQTAWRLVRPFFPRRVVEKMDFISPVKHANERERLLKYISLENLPTRYGGGNNTWPLTFTLP